LKKGKADAFPIPIFKSTMLGYVLGIATTMFVMYAFEAAQPALLYLVPACLITSFGQAYLSKSLTEMLEYKEGDDENEGEEEKQEENK